MRDVYLPDDVEHSDVCACKDCHGNHLQYLSMKQIMQNAKDGLQCCLDYIDEECCPDRPLEHGALEIVEGTCFLCEMENAEFVEAEHELRKALSE